MPKKLTYKQLQEKVQKLEEVVQRHRETEAKLEESEWRYRLLAENSSDVIWTMTLEGLFTYISPSSVALSGFTPEEICQISLKDSVTPESYKIIVERLAEELELPPDERSSVILELQQYAKDGSIIDVEVSARLIVIDHGFPIGIQGTTRDISERKQAEAVIAESEKKFQEMHKINCENRLLQV